MRPSGERRSSVRLIPPSSRPKPGWSRSVCPSGLRDARPGPRHAAPQVMQGRIAPVARGGVAALFFTDEMDLAVEVFFQPRAVTDADDRRVGEVSAQEVHHAPLADLV